MKVDTSVCELVTEHVALGEPLGDLAPHIATCASCRRLVAVPRGIAAATARPDPGLGFSARMTIGAQHRFAVRRRRRLAAYAATSVAAAAVAVFFVTRTPSAREDVGAIPKKELVLEGPQPTVPTKQDDTPTAVGDSDLVELVRLADTKRARREGAEWGRIKKPLAPYIKLVKGVAP